MQLFNLILFQIEILIQLFHKICYLLNEIVVLLRTFIPAAGMLYISLPVLLSVKSLVFNFPSVASGCYQFLCIRFCYLNACNPCKFSGFFISILIGLLLCIINQIYVEISKHNLILICDICSNCFFFRQCSVFFCYGRCTAFFIANDIIPPIIFADLKYLL